MFDDPLQIGGRTRRAPWSPVVIETAPADDRYAVRAQAGCKSLVDVGPPSVAREQDGERVPFPPFVAATSTSERSAISGAVTRLGSSARSAVGIARYASTNGGSQFAVTPKPCPTRGNENNRAAPVPATNARVMFGAQTWSVSPCNTIQGTIDALKGARSYPGSPRLRRDLVAFSPRMAHNEVRSSMLGQTPG